jgi:Putative prokaryotic signal transducing protein
VQHSALVVARAFGTQAEADLAKSVLEAAGIDAMIQADTAGGMRQHLAWSGAGFRVLVREEDAAAAMHSVRRAMLSLFWSGRSQCRLRQTLL